MACRLHAALKSLTMRSRADGDASIGTRSLSCRFTPQAPTSARSATASTGGKASRTTSPNGSRPRLPTVQRPNENLCSGRGSYRSAMMVDVESPQGGIETGVGVVSLVHRAHVLGLRRGDHATADQS